VRTLSLLEARVLGVLVEKAATVPDTYPLSLNALVTGCNQKTSRDPVLAASESEVLAAVDALKVLALVVESSGSRVARYEHNVGRALGLPSQAVALLAVLALRGPQTASELRANAERLHHFADAGSVEAFLDELAARPADKGGPLVLRLPRAPGAREPRWTQLLTGAVDTTALAAAADEIVAAGELAALRADQQALRRELDALREQVERLYRELGVSRG
jgi:uncharacterized protein YceH (UPF0502 family)